MPSLRNKVWRSSVCLPGKILFCKRMPQELSLMLTLEGLLGVVLIPPGSSVLTSLIVFLCSLSRIAMKMSSAWRALKSWSTSARRLNLSARWAHPFPEPCSILFIFSFLTKSLALSFCSLLQYTQNCWTTVSYTGQLFTQLFRRWLPWLTPV